MLKLTNALTGFIFLAAASSAFARPMTQEEREHVVAHLQMTQSWLTDEVSSLSTAQLNFRPAPDRWTVAEVVQHLVVAEPNYWKILQDALKQPPNKLDKQATDADVLWYGIDLEISTHEQRHILQIREIKASAGFPKK
jgi:DinB superfamily